LFAPQNHLPAFPAGLLESPLGGFLLINPTSCRHLTCPDFFSLCPPYFYGWVSVTFHTLFFANIRIHRIHGRSGPGRRAFSASRFFTLPSLLPIHFRSCGFYWRPFFKLFFFFFFVPFLPVAVCFFRPLPLLVC